MCGTEHAELGIAHYKSNTLRNNITLLVTKKYNALHTVAIK